MNKRPNSIQKFGIKELKAPNSIYTSEKYVPRDLFNYTIYYGKDMIDDYFTVIDNIERYLENKDIYSLIQKHPYFSKNIDKIEQNFSLKEFTKSDIPEFIDFLFDIIIDYIPFEEGREVYDIWDIFSSKALPKLKNYYPVNDYGNILLEMGYFTRNNSKDNIEYFHVSRRDFYTISEVVYKYLNIDEFKMIFLNQDFYFKNFETDQILEFPNYNYKNYDDKYLLVILDEPLKKGFDHPHSDIKKYPNPLKNAQGIKIYFPDDSIIASTIMAFKILVKEDDNLLLEDIGSLFSIYDLKDNSQLFITYRD